MSDVQQVQYVEQGRVMMQDWVDRVELLEWSEVRTASRHLAVYTWCREFLPMIENHHKIQSNGFSDKIAV
jgi:hypothetical protein